MFSWGANTVLGGLSYRVTAAAFFHNPWVIDPVEPARFYLETESPVSFGLGGKDFLKYELVTSVHLPVVLKFEGVLHRCCGQKSGFELKQIFDVEIPVEIFLGFEHPDTVLDFHFL